MIKVYNEIFNQFQNLCQRFKGYGFVLFTKNMSRSLKSRYGQKLLDSTKTQQQMHSKLLQKEQ